MSGYEIYEKIRKEKGLKDADISRLTGIGSGTLSDWKKGRYELKAEKLMKIADALGVSLDELTGNFYEDAGVKEYTLFLKEHPEYRVLFDASRKVKPEDIALVRALIERFNNGADS